MKNKLAAEWATRAAATKFLVPRWAIWKALNGDTVELTKRLRKGSASPEEIEFAADLIEGKVKPRRLRRGQPSLRKNDGIAQVYFQLRALHPKWREKQIIGKVVDIFSLKGKHGRHVYAVLKTLDPKRRELYEAQAGVLAKHVAHKPNLLKALSEGRLMVVGKGEWRRVVEFPERTEVSRKRRVHFLHESDGFVQAF